MSTKPQLKINKSSLLLALPLLALPLASCTTTHDPGAAAKRVSAAKLGQPLTRALTPGVVHGWVEAQRADGAAWTRLEPGKPATRLTALRAAGRGAMLSIAGAAGGGAKAGKLWLRGGAQLRLGQAADGSLRLLLVRGEARVSLYDPALRALLLRPDGRGGLSARTISGQDLLARATGADKAARVAVAPTALRPRAADWTLSMTEGAAHGAGAGVGSLRTRGARGDNEVSLELRRVKVQAYTSADMAETRVEHVFYNASGQQLEGTFRFPLPERAALIGLAMEIDGKLMEGELVERQKARQTYESIVESMQDPALLEWEQGNTFKLRVFPIEPRSEKRIVLRYVAPLERSPEGLTYRYDTAAAEMQRTIPRFAVELDGRTLVKTQGFTPGRSVAAHVEDSSADKAAREVRKDGVYTALRLRPDWSRLPLPQSPRGPRDLLLIVDTSRSALESRKLALQALRALLSDLRGADRFNVLAADLTVRSHAPRMVAADAEQIRRAVSFIEGIEPDGASDLGLALRTVGQRLATRSASARLRPTQAVYLGDGTATWGETDEQKLAAIAADALGQTPLHAVILGKGASAGLLRRLAARQGGLAVKPRNPLDVQRLALRLAGGAELPRLRQLQIRAGEHDEVFPAVAPTLYHGDELVVLMRTPAGKPPARQVVLEGFAGTTPFVQTFPASVVAPARYVAHRWARRQLVRLEADKAPKEAQVEHSLQYGVMSRHTAFLVLESEEAYKRFQIARKNGPKPTDPAAAAPKVTGGDLESLGQARASLSPDHFQPGDPEVQIPAPADARSVVVVFPFGETKVARYEPALKAWTVRFLVAQETPDGTYQITVRITHRGGRVELLRLSYVVDTKAPTVRVAVRKHRGRAGYYISASQIVTQHELVQEARRDQIAGNSVSLSGAAGLRRYAAVVKDASRVEVQLPDGRVLRLWPQALGRFGATWLPGAPLGGKVPLKVVAVDKAHNKSVIDLVFDPASGTLTREGSAQ